MAKIIDTHTHIYDEQFAEDFDEVVERIEEQLESAVVIGCDLETSLTSVALANKYPFIYAVIGVHPMDIKKYNDEVEKELERLALNEEKVVAIGEIGLDYHWMEDPKDVQIEVFKRQIKLSKDHDLPFVVHTRDALEDTYEVIKEASVGEQGGIMHSYSGSLEMAERFVELGMMISFSGVVTFKKAVDVQEAAQNLPLDKILVETDAPYLAPVPKRGRENRTAYTRYVVDKIAELRSLTVGEVAQATYENALRIFNLKED